MEAISRRGLKGTGQIYSLTKNVHLNVREQKILFSIIFLFLISACLTRLALLTGFLVNAVGPTTLFFLSRLLQVETAELRDVRTDGRMRSSQRKIHRRRSEIPSGQLTAGWLPLEKKLSWRRLPLHLSYHRAGAQQGIGAAIDGEGPLVGPARNTKSNWGPTYKKNSGSSMPKGGEIKRTPRRVLRRGIRRRRKEGAMISRFLEGLTPISAMQISI